MLVESSTKAFIYAGKGGYCSSLPNIEQLIKKLSGWTITHFSDETFSPSKWDPKHTVCVFLGGEATQIERAIGDQSVELKEFFKDGGRGLFLCGSSFATACRRVYNKKEKGGVINLFRGSAIGPLYPHPEVGWQNRAVKIRWERTQEKGYVMLNGGGYYQPDDSEKVEVLATYQDGKIAAFLQRYGQGTIIHSMFHFEETDIRHNPDFMSGIDEMTKRMIDKRFPDIDGDQKKLSQEFITSCSKDIFQRLHSPLNVTREASI